jgi:glycosyltransferase involved in cell wall biosynthesis
MGSAKMQISVIVPVYNCERYLGEALRSILDQTYPATEVIVVDDGSTDHSGRVAHEFASAVRYAVQPNSGAGAARNHGIGLARGTHLAFLDADDVWTCDKLQAQIDALQAEPDLDAVFGQVRQFQSPELRAENAGGTHASVEVMAGYHVGTMLVTREAFDRVGPFETTLNVGEFISWYLRATELGLRSLMLPRVVMLRRLHDANTGLLRRPSYTDYVRALKASLDRRRALGGGGADSDQSAG